MHSIAYGKALSSSRLLKESSKNLTSPQGIRPQGSLKEAGRSLEELIQAAHLRSSRLLKESDQGLEYCPS